ncbi:MAG: hypothetical protein GY865_04035 [candidate division Zixibacteria bacterium]|nr:hypothetical protein [candidate division Zixibacteria bacterium]
MFIRSGLIGYNIRPVTVILFFIISTIAFVPLSLFGQSNETGNNIMKLIWTANGDDNNWGQASFYDIRYSTEPIGTDTVRWWQSAIKATNIPNPSRSGKKDSCVIENLSIHQHYYFAIRSADEAYNWSHISKIAELPVISCGDVSEDGVIDESDLKFLLYYLYTNNSSEPLELINGDVDNSGDINVADAMYIINYRHNSGPPPVCGP